MAPIKGADLGCKVLREPDAPEATIDIVAIHGKAAHPVQTWGDVRPDHLKTEDATEYINWLDDAEMLPKELPTARIIQFGYESASYGKDAIDIRVASIAGSLLAELSDLRHKCDQRPLLFIAHSFGGLVLVKALLLASDRISDHHSIFRSATGLVFLGTPFRGTHRLYHDEILQQITALYERHEVIHEAYRLSNAENHWLKDLVDDFFVKVPTLEPKIACFYELEQTDMGRLLQNKEGFVSIPDRYRFMHVDETSACLDCVTELIEKHPRKCDHFRLNKFADPGHPDWRTLVRVLKNIARRLPKRTHIIQLRLATIPISDHFVPRPTEFEKLESFFRPAHGPTRRSLFIVYGHGGMGKTQLCANFARSQQERFTAIFWLDGSSRDVLRQSLANIAAQLPIDCRPSLSSEASIDARLQAEIDCVQQWLSTPSNTDWLLVFDNVDRDYQAEPEDPQAYDYHDFLPPVDHGNILLTTRLTTLHVTGTSLHLREVDQELGQKILEKRVGGDVPDAERLNEKLGGLPLALTQAGAYLRHTRMAVSKYIQFYDTTWSGLMESQHKFRSREYQQSIITTWKISYDRVEAVNPTAVRLLDLWAFLYPGDVWSELLSFSTDALDTRIDAPIWLRDLARNELVVQNSIAILTQYSLITAASDQHGLSIHTVVHTWCLHNIGLDDVKGEFYAHALWIVSNAIRKLEMLDESETARRLVPHAKILGRQVRDYDVHRDLILMYAYNYLAIFSYRWNGETEAELLFKGSLQVSEEVLGPDHEATLIIVQEMCALYAKQHRLVEAEQMCQQALQRSQRAFGPKSTSTLDAISQLGVIYEYQKKFVEAERYCKLALKGYEEVLGRSHASTLQSTKDLSSIYRSQGRLADAEKWCKQALQGCEEARGSSDIMTLAMVSDLALIYYMQNELAEAEQTFQRALQGFEVMLGPDHTSTLHNAISLCLVYVYRGDLGRAASTYKRVHQSYRSPPPIIQSFLDDLPQMIKSIFESKLDAYKADAEETQSN